MMRRQVIKGRAIDDDAATRGRADGRQQTILISVDLPEPFSPTRQ
jgi:hypothetical protein